MVERYVRDVEAASSNLVTSTKTQEGEGLSLSFLSFSQSPPIPNFSNALHLIVLRPKRLRKMIHSGAKHGSESCHLDQNQKRKARPSFFDFRLKIIDLSFSNAEHLIVLRPKRLRKMIHLGAKQGSESCHLDQGAESLT